MSINTALARTLSSSSAELSAAAANSVDLQQSNAQTLAPSPIVDSEALLRVIKEGSNSPERVQRVLNVSLLNAVTQAKTSIVEVIFSRPDRGPSPCTIQQALARSAISKVSSFGESLYDISTEQLEWAREARKIYQILKNISQNLPQNLVQNPSQARAATPPARLIPTDFSAQG